MDTPSVLAVLSAVFLGVSVLLFVEGVRLYAVITFAVFLVSGLIAVIFGGVVVGIAILIFSCWAIFGACAIGMFSMMVRS